MVGGQSYKGRTVRERAKGQYKILRVIWVVLECTKMWFKIIYFS